MAEDLTPEQQHQQQKQKLQDAVRMLVVLGAENVNAQAELAKLYAVRRDALMQHGGFTREEAVYILSQRGLNV